MIGQLLRAIVSWPAAVGVLLVVGLLPGWCLRIIVLLYPKSSGVRGELVGELYHIPRWMQPFWVVEQLEPAVLEGLLRRRYSRRGLFEGAGTLVVLLSMSIGLAGVAGGIGGFLCALTTGGPLLYWTVWSALAPDAAAALTLGILLWRTPSRAADSLDLAFRMAVFGGLPAGVVVVLVRNLPARLQRRRTRHLN